MHLTSTLMIAAQIFELGLNIYRQATTCRNTASCQAADNALVKLICDHCIDKIVYCMLVWRVELAECNRFAFGLLNYSHPDKAVSLQDV